MDRRGRPNKNGVKPGWMFFRVAMVLHAYDEARAGGEKWSAAVAAAVSAVCSQMPEMPISETGVKRILAEFRPKGSIQTMIIRREIGGEPADRCFEMARWMADQPRGTWEVPTLRHDESESGRLGAFTINVGPAPRYRRHNAKS